MTFQITKDGDVKTGEFSEVSYSGKGNGTDIYIDTGKVARDITNFSITFKYEEGATGNYDGVAGAMINTNEYFWLRQTGASNVYGVYLGAANLFAVPTMTYGNIYTVTVIKNSTSNYTVIVYDETNATQHSTETKDITGSVPSNNLWICARDHLTGTYHYHTLRTIYKFSIDGETWYLNKGTGTTITGDQGTELTISGITTNFWNIQTDVFNYPSHLSAIKQLEYAGKGDGSTIYIDTGIPADEVDDFEIIFKWYYQSTNVLFGVLGASGSNSRYYLGDVSGLARMGFGNNSAAVTLTSYISDGNVYKLRVTQTSTLNYTITLYDESGNQLYTTDIISTATSSNNFHIFAYNAATSYPTQKEIYQFTINGETFYMNEGEGSTIQGSNGTVLDVNGTLTDFWQLTGGNATNGKLTAPEFVEDYTYTGHGNGTDISITTTISPVDITNLSIIFKYSTYENLNAYFGSLTDSSNRFVLYKYPTTNNLSFAAGNAVIFFALSSYITLGHIYKMDLVIDGLAIHIDFYEWNTSTEEFDLVYTDDGTLPVGTTLGTSPIRIFNRTYSANTYWVEDNIYMITINDETWYFNEGTGSTVTGSKGTEWVIDGTLTNFWQPSDIPNLDAQMKSYIDRTHVKREMIEE